MKFRPLCIDYHSRAQEIVATERDIHARRMALRSLPNPSSPCDRRRRRPNSQSEDGIGPGGRGEASLDDDRNKSGSSSSKDDDGICDDDQHTGKVVERLGNNGVNSFVPTQQLNTEANGMNSRRVRILKCMDMLGPAVHPSECAFRSIAPVTKGPIRGNTIPITQQLPETLTEITKSYSDHVDKKINAAIASLETGRSRFDSPSGHVFGFSSEESVQHGLGHNDLGIDRTTFTDAMKIAYGRNSDCHDVDDSCLDLDPEKENALKSQIWTQHVNDLPMTKSIYLMHEPDDLAKICRLKSFRSSATTSFASEITRSFRPQLRTPKSDSRGMFRARDLYANKLDKRSAKPLFDTGKVDCHSRSLSSPLAKLLDFDQDNSGMGQINDCLGLRDNIFRITAKCDDTNKDIVTTQSDVLAWVNSPFRLTISLDPDFDPLQQIPPKKERKIHERLVQMNETCNASSISALLRLPGRFEESHELSFRLPKTSRHLEFFSTILKSFKESNTRDDSLESLLAVYETRAVLSCMKFQPRQIRQDTDIETFMLSGADTETPMLLDTKKSLIASNLKLPSFYETFTSARKMIIGTGGQSGGVNQKRFVESSSRVCKMVTLKKLVNSSKLTCLFLPQSIVEKSTEACAGSNIHKTTQQGPMPTAVESAIRSCVRYNHGNIEQGKIKFLQDQCSIYPVAPWFESDSASDLASAKLSKLDATIPNEKRNIFCDNAKAKSNDEGFRCLLLTGCSSKRNDEYKYSYRGFLTNQVVDPHVFQRRYNAMVQVDKYHKRKSVGRSHSPPHDAFFTQMVLRVHVEAFARHKKSNSKGRSAPYSIKMNTSRHGHGQITASMVNKKNLNTEKAGFTIDMEHIEELATCFTNRLAQAAETNYCDSDGKCVVKTIGKNSLKTRGELLHLLTKARELEDEKKSYLAEMAVVNRLGTGHIEAKVSAVDILHPSLHLTGIVDLAVPNDYQRVEKRKSESDPLLDEHNDKKSKKKKKKKDKKKKEKKKLKRQHKRKHKDAAPHEDSKKCKASEAVFQEEQSQELSAATSTTKIMRVVVPSIPLGMTPIIPYKKLEPIKKPRAVEQSETQDERLTLLAIEDIAYSPAAVETSPDSVAALNSGAQTQPLDSKTRHDVSLPVESFCSSETEAHYNHGVSQSGNFEYTDNGIDESSRHVGVDHVELYENESAFSNDSHSAPSQARSPINLLTSENFLEAFGQIVAELASGRWGNALSGSENSGFDDSTQGITVIDCPLLDFVGVDIEYSDDSALIVQYLSSWLENNRNGNYGGNASNMQHGARSFIRRLVLLAASGRYRTVHVILCLDVEMSSVLTGQIITLQNAVIHQIGCPAERVTFEYVSPRAVSASIALRLTSAPPECGGLHFISDQSVQERARFLITLVPMMTVHMALRCCLENSSKSYSLSDLFEIARSTSRDMFPYKMEGVLSKCVSDQLWSTLNVDISHAYRL